MLLCKARVPLFLAALEIHLDRVGARFHHAVALGVGRLAARGLVIRSVAAIAQHAQVRFAQDVLAARRLKDLAVLQEQPLERLLIHLDGLATSVVHLLPHGPEAALSNHQLLQAALRVGREQQLLLDGAARGEAVHDDGPLLADAVAAVLRLQVLLGVEVGVEEDDGVGTGEVDALAAGAGRQEEDAMVGVRVEGVDLRAARLLRDAAVDAARVPAAQLAAVVLEDVELHGELREDEHLVVVREEMPQEPVEEQHLARGGDDGLVDGDVGRDGPGVVKVVRRVAHEAVLHEGVV